MLARLVRFLTYCLVYGRCWGFALVGVVSTAFRCGATMATKRTRVRALPCGVDGTIPSPVVEIQQAWVLGREGCVTDASGRLMAAVAPRAGFLSGWAHPIMQRLHGWRQEEPADEAVLLSGGHADNYYHWMFEVLPRIMFLERAGHSLGSSLVLVPVGQPFQRQSLAVLGVSAERSRALSADGAFQVRKLWCTLPVLPPHVGRAEVCRWLRERLGRTVKTGSRRLLLQRRQGKRSIVNFDALANSLVPLGFEVMVAEKLTFDEQIEWFSSAEWVVAPHGAGLANLVFCRPGTRVVEILSKDYLSHLYADISADCSLDYRAVTATPVGSPWEFREGSKQLCVDTDEIVSLIKIWRENKNVNIAVAGAAVEQPK